MADRARGLLLCVGVAALLCIPSAGNDFVYDDHEVIVSQPQPAASDLVRIFAEPHFLGLPYYRPVVRATLLGQKALHGDRAWAFRLGNAALMGLAAWLAFALLRTPAFGVKETPALLAAALFGVHPLASSCVYPIASGRETLLPAVLILAALLAWLRGRRSWAFAGFAAALFAKEQAVIVPALFVWADACRVAPDLPRGGWSRWLRRHAPALLILMLYLVARRAVLGPTPYELAVTTDPLAPLLSYAYGLQVAIAPFAGLVYEPEPRVWLSAPRLAAAGLAVMLLAWAVRRAGAPSPRLLAFWAGWFVLTQLPTANLLHQEARFAERYAFLAFLALPAVAAGAASAAWSHAGVRRAGVVAALVAILAAAGVSVGRAAYFRDDATFAQRWLQVDPQSPDAHHLLGMTLAQRGQLDQALVHYRASLARSHEPAEVLHNIGTVLALQGHEDEAREALRRALAIRPDHPEAHVNLGSLLARQGRLDEALDHDRRALRVEPRMAEAHNNLGGALARRGELDAAATHLESAVRLRPDYADAHRNLGLVRLQQGRPAEAAAAFAAALRLDPSDAESRRQLRRLEAPGARP